MKTLKISVAILAAIGAGLYAHNLSDSKLQWIPCQACDSGWTVELSIGHKGLKLNEGQYGNYGFLKDGYEKPRVYSSGFYHVVAGAIPRFDRLLVILVDDKLDKPKVVRDVLTRELLVSNKSDTFVFLEDPAIRNSENHSIWCFQIDGKKIKTEKVFDAQDTNFGGSATPDIGADGALGLRWLPRQDGFFFFSHVGGVYATQVVHFTSHGFRRESKKIDDPNDIPGDADKPEWVDDVNCEFHFKGGRKKRFSFR